MANTSTLADAIARAEQAAQVQQSRFDELTVHLQRLQAQEDAVQAEIRARLEAMENSPEYQRVRLAVRRQQEEFDAAVKAAIAAWEAV